MFERRQEVDGLALRHFVATTLPSTPAPSRDELELLRKSLTYLNPKPSADAGTAFERLRGSLIKYPSLHVFTRREITSAGSWRWGKCVGDVDETLEDSFAWVWRWCSYERLDRHVESNGKFLVRQTDASEDQYARRSQIVKVEYKISPGVAHRRSMTKYTWFMLASGLNGHEAYAIAFEPAPDPLYNTNRAPLLLGFTKKSVEARSHGIFLFEKIASRITRMTYVSKFDLGGSTLLPGWVVTSHVVTSVMSQVFQLQDKYRRVDKVVDEVRRELRREIVFTTTCRPPSPVFQASQAL